MSSNTGSPNPIKQGKLLYYKEGFLKKGWKDCWAVLFESSALHLFKDPSQKSKLADLNLETSINLDWLAFGESAVKYNPPKIPGPADPKNPPAGTGTTGTDFLIAIPKDKNRNSILWLRASDKDDFLQWIQAVAKTAKGKFKPPMLGNQRADHVKIENDVIAEFGLPHNEPGHQRSEEDDWTIYWLGKILLSKKPTPVASAGMIVGGPSAQPAGVIIDPKIIHPVDDSNLTEIEPAKAAEIEQKSSSLEDEFKNMQLFEASNFPKVGQNVKQESQRSPEKIPKKPEKIERIDKTAKNQEPKFEFVESQFVAHSENSEKGTKKSEITIEVKRNGKNLEEIDQKFEEFDKKFDENWQKMEEKMKNFKENYQKIDEKRENFDENRQNLQEFRENSSKSEEIRGNSTNFSEIHEKYEYKNEIFGVKGEILEPQNFQIPAEFPQINGRILESGPKFEENEEESVKIHSLRKEVENVQEH